MKLALAFLAVCALLALWVAAVFTTHGPSPTATTPPSVVRELNGSVPQPSP
ncbi:MAG TPA: hypothetical protein VHV82_13555 [Sporichthyaceae bacterium]|nr:hypothetical protein [Sporichthyaceae bacterium]